MQSSTNSFCDLIECGSVYETHGETLEGKTSLPFQNVNVQKDEATEIDHIDHEMNSEDDRSLTDFDISGLF